MKTFPKTFFFSISLLIGAIFFILAVRTVGVVHIAETLANLGSGHALIILVLTLLLVLIWLLRWRVALKFFKEKLTWKTLINARLAGFAVSSLTPAMGFGGEPAQYLLAEKEVKSKKNLISSIIIDKIFYGTVNYFITILGVFLFLINIPISFKLRLIIVLALAIVAILGFLFYLQIFSRHRLFRKKKNQLIAGVEKRLHKFFDIKNIYFWEIIGLSILRGTVYLARFYFIILFLGASLSIKELFLVVGVLLLIGMIPVPSALGGHELSQAFVFSAMGIGSSLGISMILIMRVFDLGLVAIGLFIIFHQSLKKFRFFGSKLG